MEDQMKAELKKQEEELSKLKKSFEEKKKKAKSEYEEEVSVFYSQKFVQVLDS